MIDDKVWLPIRTEVTSRQDRPDEEDSHAAPTRGYGIFQLQEIQSRPVSGDDSSQAEMCSHRPAASAALRTDLYVFGLSICPL
jgi:hypothetical protein